MNPTAGQTLQQIATTAATVTWQEIARYNWATENALELNRVFVEQYGCSAPDAGNPENSPLYPDKAPSKIPILIPKPWKQDSVEMSKTHTISVKKRKPQSAVGITALDKWFIPNTETCNVDYQLEGVQNRASLVEMLVWASNYCDVTATFTDGFEKYVFKPLDVPVWLNRRPNTEADERVAVQVRDWKGETTTKEGAMKKRTITVKAPNARFINVAGSPYTVMIRYRRPGKDTDAQLRLDPFWPLFNDSGAPIADSLIVKWEVSGCARLTAGQLLIYDKTDTIVYRKGLAKADVSNGKHKYDWSKDTKNTVVAAWVNMPYRVQIQAHTGPDDDEGVGLAAMHTEVRMYAHSDYGTQADPKDDTNSALLAVAPVQTDKLTDLTAGDFKWYKRKLFEAGFHPGPAHKDETSDEFTRSLRDFQFSYPKTGAAPFQRQQNDGKRNVDSQSALNGLPAEERKLFGNDADRSDYDIATAEPILNDKTKKMIVWVDDRHTFTCPPGEAPNAAMAMDHYRGEMSIGDRDKVDEKSICEPWIPLEAKVALLSKAEGLDLVAIPVITDDMRRAIGPLRIDWTFREPEQEFDLIDDSMYHADRVRTKTFVKYIAEKYEAKLNKRKVQNCPAKYGGIRPSSASDYYKAPFGLKDESLTPWTSLSDSKEKNVYSIVHDDVGQDEDNLFEPYQGKAGIYLHLSRIGGDGYRLRAEVGFADPAEGKPHPNWKTLKQRYPKVPKIDTAEIRLWRKASIRGHVLWAPNGDNHWGNLGLGGGTPFTSFYQGTFVHFVLERDSSGGAPASSTADQLIDPVNDLNAFKDVFANSCSWTELTDRAKMTFDAEKLWPWLGENHFGIQHVPSPGTKPAQYRNQFLTSSVQNETWRSFRNRAAHLLIDQAEKKYGRMRGHLIIEFLSSSNYSVQRYYCSTCRTMQCLMESSGTWDTGVGEACKISGCGGTLIALTTVSYSCGTCGNTEDNIEDEATAPDGANCTCAGTPAMASTGQDNAAFRNDNNEALPWNHAGMSLGGLFVCSDDSKAETWAHEFAHHRHLEHAEKTGGTKNRNMHDSRPNAVSGDFAGGDKALQKQWDRVCVMGYTKHAPPKDMKYFCGKCVLKLRGWAVESLPRPKKDVN